jgi:adenylate cyclase
MVDDRSQRRLAAILAADVAGYSRLMGASESGTLEALKSHRRELVDGRIDDFKGRIVKLTGDGILVEFPSVVNAVACAVEIQRKMAERNVDVAPDKRIEFRIGVHLGDIIYEDDDIFGDGVNVAARIEGVARPGGVCVSSTVYDNVGNRLELAFEDMGEQALKNIDRRVRIYEVVLDSASLRAVEAGQMVGQDKPSIAVLPFANMSGEPEQEYFSDGITEDIITDLSKISGLGVTARNTSFQFKGKNVDVPQVARQLKVSHILEGSVRRAGGRVRITAQLIDGASGEHVWADRYDRDISDIFALQDEISSTIVKVLKVKLLPGERAEIERHPTTDPDAYKLFLMARHFSVKGSLRHQKVIERLCRRALEIDGNYAAAWALLAVALSNRRLIGGEPSEGGMEAAERAISLDPNLADAYAAKGRILSDRGLYAEAVGQLEIALRLDPDSYDVNVAAGRCAVAEHRHEDAIRYLESAAQASPLDFWALGMVISEYEGRGDQSGAASAARRALDRIEPIVTDQPDHGSALSFGIMALIELGERERALEWAERALLLDPDNNNLHYNLACALLKIDATERALNLLARVFQQSQPEALQWMKVDPDLVPIREHPRFRAMLAEAETRLAAKGHSD